MFEVEVEIEDEVEGNEDMMDVAVTSLSHINDELFDGIELLDEVCCKYAVIAFFILIFLFILALAAGFFICDNSFSNTSSALSRT